MKRPGCIELLKPSYMSKRRGPWFYCYLCHCYDGGKRWKAHIWTEEHLLRLLGE